MFLLPSTAARMAALPGTLSPFCVSFAQDSYSENRHINEETDSLELYQAINEKLQKFSGSFRCQKGVPVYK